MLSVPFKRSDQNIDVAGPVRRYLISNFSEADAEKYSEDVETLQKLRQLAVIVEAPTTAGRDALTAYYHAVTRAEPLFPVSAVDVKIAFTWKDAYVPTKKSEQSTLHFERVCVFFNIGALESHAGTTSERTTDEGLKEACRHFQVAAGIFQHIRDHLSGGLLGALTPDLTPDGLSLASTLMLAQAQACFFEKATRDVKRHSGMRAKIVSKLAAAAYDLYSQALTHLRSGALAPLLDKSWAALTEFQAEYFAAAAQYWEAVAAHELAEESGQGYGIEIARYTMAEDAVGRALKLASKGSMGQNITAACQQLQEQVSRGKATISKDNQRIYLEPVPPTSSLPTLSRACMVRPTPPAALEPPPATAAGALFKDLLPRGAKKALDAYKAAVAALVAEEEGKAKEANRAARAELAAVGLPGSLEAHDSRGGIPDGVWSRLCDARQRTGGLSALKAKVEEVESAAERARSVLETVSRTLDDEERRDDAFRARYCGGGAPGERKYDGMSSRQLATDVRKDVEHYRELWRRARASDKVVIGRMEEPELKADLELIEMNRADIDAQMPAAAAAATAGSGGGGGNGVVDTSALSMRLMGLAQLINERDAAVQRLQDRASGEDLAPLLMEAALAGNTGGGSVGAGEEAIFSAVADGALAAYEPPKRELEANIERQTGLLAAILQENERFAAAKAADPATLARERFLQRLHRGQDAFFELHAQLSEGAAFYGDLLRRLATLNQGTEDLVYTQGLQRREYEVQFSHQQATARQAAEDEELARRMAAEANISNGSATPAATAAPGPATAPYAPAYPSMAPGPAAAHNRPLPQAPQPPGGQYGYGAGVGAPPPHPQYYGAPPVYGNQGHNGYGAWPQQQQPPPPQQQQYHTPQYAPQQQPSYYAQPQPPPQQQRPQPPAPPAPPARPAAPAPAVSNQGYLLPPGYGQAGGDPKVARLVEMGFPQDRARAALSACNGDENAAIARLLNGA